MTSETPNSCQKASGDKRGLPAPMVIDGLQGAWTKVNGIKMFYQHGGGDKGKPLLLVHGLFQTGMMWRRVAGALMRDHYLIIPDNRGYGQTEKPAAMNHLTKKLQAADLKALLDQLGVEKCVVLSHDRGARIARTFAMDYPERLLGVCFMDMLPTEYIYQEMTCTQTGSHHWDQLFKLASPMAEDLLVNKPDNIKIYVDNFYERTPGFIKLLKDDGVYDYYMQCIQSPGAIMAMLNDYRAAYSIDVPRIRAALDRGERISAPVQLLWGEKGNASKSPIVEIYEARCSNTVEGASVPSGHYLAEEQPEITQKLLLNFVDQCYARQTS
uniref:Esterase lipase n=1 Tax=Tremella fuciformis TaxID=64657 RepID=D5KY38_9TREE|nr:esterase lipase [Tremella fuciformis]